MHNLKNEDKNKIRENLYSFMEDAPIKKNQIFAKKWKPILPSLKLNLQFMPTKVIAVALMAVLLLGGSATAFASEDSLPGDTLYPVKSATEKMRGLLKWSDESRADWKATMAERKLGEIEKLYEEGKITDEKKEVLVTKVNKWLERAGAHIEKMKAKGNNHPAFNVAARLGNALEAHEKNLEKWQEKFADKAEMHEKFAEKLGERADKFEATRLKLEDRIKNQNGERSKSAAEGKLKAAENKIAEVARFISKAKETLGEDRVANAEAKLQMARELLGEGKIRLDEEKYGEAFILFHKAHYTAQIAQRLVAVQSVSDNPGATATSTVSSKLKRGKGKAFGFFKDKIRNGENENESDDEEDENETEE